MGALLPRHLLFGDQPGWRAADGIAEIPATTSLAIAATVDIFNVTCELAAQLSL
jgi:hypothetical protein